MTTQKSWRRRTRLQVLFLLVLLAGVGYGFYALQEATEAEGKVFAVFERPDGSKSEQLRLEVVNDEAGRQAGLMYRKAMQPDDGMVFVFPQSSVQQFWMKNTYLSLDMLFIDENKRVIGILPNVPPLNLEPRGVPGKSQYVIELVAGAAGRLKIVPGSIFEPTDLLPKGQ